jgi:hypothetical protein
MVVRRGVRVGAQGVELVGISSQVHLSLPARAPVHLFYSRSRATVGYFTYSLKTQLGLEMTDPCPGAGGLSHPLPVAHTTLHIRRVLQCVRGWCACSTLQPALNGRLGRLLDFDTHAQRYVIDVQVPSACVAWAVHTWDGGSHASCVTHSIVS